MKFAIVGPRETNNIVQVLNMFDMDVDYNKPDYVISYGGDGTILFSEKKYPGIPKITLRSSEGGSKCNYNEFDLEDVLFKIDDNDFDIREELKLEAIFQNKSYLALNEVQLHNELPIKAVRFSVEIIESKESDDKILYDNIIGDGVIIATPFGSSAYYTSVGGEKFNDGIGIALNNPFNCKQKPIVTSKDSNILIKIIRDTGLLMSDNDDKFVKLKEGDEVLVQEAPYPAKFVIINN
jgi:NAD+ kinase